MQRRSAPHGFAPWRSLAAKVLIGLVGVAIVTLAISFLEFGPPKPPTPPLYRIAPGVSGLEFYSAGCTEHGGKREYSYHFTKRGTRCIFVQLHSSYFSVPDPSKAFLYVLSYGPDGQVIKEEKLPVASKSSSTAITINEPGTWQPGIYRVELIVGDKLIAADEFQISDQ